MRNRLILVVFLFCILGCKKRDLPRTTGSQQQPQTEQPNTEQFKISGIGDTATIKMVDEIIIPITITSNSGKVEEVTLSVSDLPMRMTAQLADNSGTTPFSTTLKIRTYLVAYHSMAAIKITVQSVDGRQMVHSVYPAIDYRNQDAIKLFYDVYTQKVVEKFTYEVNNDWETIKNPRAPAPAPEFNYDPMTGQLRLTKLYLGNYKLIDNPNYPENYLVSSIAEPSKGLIHFEQKSLWMCNTTTQDTFALPVEAGPLNFYCGLEHGKSGYQMVYKINGLPFWVEGVIPY